MPGNQFAEHPISTIERRGEPLGRSGEPPKAACRTAILCAMLMLLSWSPGVSAAAEESLAAQLQPGITPAPGTSERLAILDALRAEVWRGHGLEVVFVVVELKVQDGWARVHTRPQSPDGANHYEDIVAVLRRIGGDWRILDLTDDNGDEIRRRFPDFPILMRDESE